jgi:hypothetical protein
MMEMNHNFGQTNLYGATMGYMAVSCDPRKTVLLVVLPVVL